MLDVGELLAGCERHGITLLDLPAAYWHELVHVLTTGSVRLPDHLRTVLVYGEAVLPERIAQWRGLAGDRIRLLNGYGPTETTVVATVADLTRHETGPVPIGRPLPGVRAAVVAGELWLLGGGLTRGYLHRPELNARRFTTLDGERAYRTGDLVTVGEDRQILYHGRLDDEVKIGGQRIDPAAIDSVLAGHPAVREAAVVAQEDDGASSGSSPSSSPRAAPVRRSCAPGCATGCRPRPCPPSAPSSPCPAPAPARSTGRDCAPPTRACPSSTRSPCRPGTGCRSPTRSGASGWSTSSTARPPPTTCRSSSTWTRRPTAPPWPPPSPTSPNGTRCCAPSSSHPATSPTSTSLAPGAVRLRTVECPAAELPGRVAAFTAETFDLSRELPLRVALFLPDEGPGATLAVLLHHVAGDGWSLTPLMTDLARAHAARTEGRAPEWEPLPVQYADYTLWQNDLLGTPDDPDSLTARGLAHWRAALDGLPEATDLPSTAPGPPSATTPAPRWPPSSDPASTPGSSASPRNTTPVS